ncbi:hypothetical protein [Amycolatopsis sp. NPDC004378]
MAETAWDREDVEAGTYYLLLEIAGEETAQRVEASAHFGPLVDDMLARLQAGDDTDELKAFLHAKVQDL